ncbi:MAG: hypothetical protein JKY88_17755 [Pseudomonadales bacterium]|nr:hypothetical protein [Pseudomonadales bacterium]
MTINLIFQIQPEILWYLRYALNQPKIIHPVVFTQSKDDGTCMIKKHTISEFDIQRLAQFVVEGSPSPDDISELIGMFLENISGIENLGTKEIEELIIAIEREVNKLQQFTKGDSK